MLPTELLAKPLKHFYMTRQAQCSNSIYGVLSWSIRKGERGQRPHMGVQRACVRVCPCDMRLLALNRVMHVFVDTPLNDTTCDRVILISISRRVLSERCLRRRKVDGQWPTGRFVCQTNISAKSHPGILQPSASDWIIKFDRIFMKAVAPCRTFLLPP